MAKFTSDESGVSTQSPKWMSLLRYTVVLLCVFGFVFIVTFWAMVESRETHVLENFRDRDIVETLKWLQDHDLRPIVYEKLDAEIDRFRIISQSPEPGMIVKTDRTVTLVVSVGTQLEIMEDYIGQNFTDAKRQIYTQLAGEAQIPRVVKIEEYSDEYEEGFIVAQLPRPNESIDVSKDLIFFVSKGLVEDVLFVEDYRLRPYTEVYNELSKRGINVQARFLVSADEKRVGFIFEQSVPLGESLIQGDVIRFVVGVEADERIEALAETKLEKARVFSLRVPFPSRPIEDDALSAEGDKLLSADENTLKQAFVCPCLEESALYEDLTAASDNLGNGTSPAGNGALAPSSDSDSPTFNDVLPGEEPPLNAATEVEEDRKDIVLRTVELVITDRTQRERRVVYENILAGRAVTLPYRAVGSGTVSIFLDGSFYRSENFYDF